MIDKKNILKNKWNQIWTTHYKHWIKKKQRNIDCDYNFEDWMNVEKNVRHSSSRRAKIELLIFTCKFNWKCDTFQINPYTIILTMAFNLPQTRIHTKFVSNWIRSNCMLCVIWFSLIYIQYTKCVDTHIFLFIWDIYIQCIYIFFILHHKILR